MELPLRLLVSSVVVGLTLPAVVSGFSALEYAQLSVRVTEGLDAIVHAAQDFYLAGGGAQTVRVDFGGAVTVHVEYITIGDARGGPWSATVSYKLTGLSPVFLLSDPPIPMTSGDGPLRLGPGRHVVRVSYDGNDAVLLEVVG